MLNDVLVRVTGETGAERELEREEEEEKRETE